MSVTKVAAFFRSALKEEPEARWVWERGKEKSGLTSESALAAAVTYLRMQARSSLRLNYISQLYLPLYLVRVHAEKSLLISGVGNTSTTIKNVTVLPPDAFENLLSHADEVQQVPTLITNLEKLVKNIDPTSITIPNLLKPTMIEPLRRLIEPSLSQPSTKCLIEPVVDINAAISIGLLMRDEISRLEHSHEHLMHMMDAINRYIEGQLNYINEERLKIHQDTAAELGMAQLLNQLEGILKFATKQCRQFIVQMDASPTKTDLIFREDNEDLIQPQILAHDFRQTLQQTSIELDVAFSQLEEAERRWLSIYEQEQIAHQQNGVISYPLEHRSLTSSRKGMTMEADSRLGILVSLRERILGSYPALVQTLHDISTKLDKQFNRFMEITAKTNDLLGEHPLIRILVPIFVVKTNNPTKYAIIPPLKLLRPSSAIHWRRSKSVPPVKAFNVRLFDENFCGALQELLRSEMITKPQFKNRLDQLGLRNNMLKHKKRIDQFLQGIQQLSIRGFLTTNLIDDLTQFWIQLK